jgi:pyrroloquinoline quinone (PQQ) biosynthesis protein C
MTQMIRKQIYIGKRHQALLRRLAKARGVSEAELIRQAIEQQAASATAQPLPPDPEAWERARAFMLELQARGPIVGQRRAWKREDAYAERENRYVERRAD